jgi:pimeloyl-ACP methyl ester carboxylesterase
MLRLEGDADTIAHGTAREALKAIFPSAQLRTFPGGGHAISAETPHEWAAAVTGFLTAT